MLKTINNWIFTNLMPHKNRPCKFSVRFWFILFKWVLCWTIMYWSWTRMIVQWVVNLFTTYDSPGFNAWHPLWFPKLTQNNSWVQLEVSPKHRLIWPNQNNYILILRYKSIILLKCYLGFQCHNWQSTYLCYLLFFHWMFYFTFKISRYIHVVTKGGVSCCHKRQISY